jgi:hypothetical protein
VRPRGWVDSEGTPLAVGDVVAFNYSGDVARGMIDYLPERVNVGAVKIRHLTKEGAIKGRTQWSSGVSRVKHGSSILVLEKA